MNMTLERFKKDAKEGAVSCNKEDVIKICEEFFSSRLSYFKKHEVDIREIFEILFNNDLFFKDDEEKLDYELDYCVFLDDIDSFIFEAIHATDLGKIILLFYEQNEKRTEEQEKKLNYIRGNFEKKFLGRLHLDY